MRKPSDFAAKKRALSDRRDVAIVGIGALGRAEHRAQQTGAEIGTELEAIKVVLGVHRDAGRVGRKRRTGIHHPVVRDKDLVAVHVLAAARFDAGNKPGVLNGVVALGHEDTQ